MANKKKPNISKLDDETIGKVKAIFLRYPVYKQLSDDFKDKQDYVSFEDRLSYHCSSDIENIRTTSSRSPGGQPERDALKMIEDNEREMERQRNIRLIEDSIVKSLKAATKIAAPKNRDLIAAALYSHLCLGVPLKMLCYQDVHGNKEKDPTEASSPYSGRKITAPTLLKYRNEAICFGAINFGFVDPDFFSA